MERAPITSKFTLIEGTYLVEVLTDDAKNGEIYALVKDMEGEYYNIEEHDKYGLYSHTL